MLQNNLIEISQLLDILGYTDLRSVRTWLSKQKIPLVKIGMKTYCARNFIDLIIENQINSFVNENYDNPSDIMAAVNSGDKVSFSELVHVPAQKQVRMKNAKSEMGKAAKDLLTKLKSA